MLRNAVLRASELKLIEATKRDGTYITDKNTVPRLVNLVLKYPDALQRSSALATRQELQNKEVNGSRLIWVTVAEEFMDGTYSGGIVRAHEEFERVDMNKEVISRSGIFTSKQAYDLFKMLCRGYAKIKPRYEASGRHNGKDFLDFCQKDKLDLLYLHLSLESINNPELSGYCLEGNVLDGGLDTAESASNDGAVKPITQKKKDRQNNIKHQQDVLAFMKERVVAEQINSKITMIKDLNISLSVLTTCWQDLDKTLLLLEESIDIEINPRKKARLEVYRTKMGENEKETAAIQEEIRLIRARDVHNEVILDVSIINTENDDSCDISNDCYSGEDFAPEQDFSTDGEFIMPRRPEISCSSVDPILCCCGCGENASGSSHRCSNTERRAMAYCLTGEEGYGSSSFCRGCACL